MTREHLSLSVLAAGIFLAIGIATGIGCAPGESGGTAGTGGVGTGGTSLGNTGGASTSGSGGAVGSGGVVGTGGVSGGSGGALGASGGTVGIGGRGEAGGAGTGGRAGSAGGASSGRGGAAAGGRAGGTGGTTGGASGTGGRSAGGGSTGTGTCTASKPANSNASGSGPHKVVVETNTDPGIAEGTIFRPMDLGGAEKYPIFVWGEGACSLNGLSNATLMAEIASHGYFVVADGTPNGSDSRSMTGDFAAMGKPLIAYINWAVAENDKSCSAYYQSLDTTKVSANGFSCGGLMAEGTVGDPRITTWGITSSGMFSANQNFFKMVHTPVLIVLGGPSDIAYENGKRDYMNIAPLGVPVMLFSKDIGHGGDLFGSRGGQFGRINLAWLNWQLKGDTGATGKGILVGTGCTYCTDSTWEVMSMGVQ